MRQLSGALVICASLAAGGCQPAPTPVEILFQAELGGEPATCETPGSGLQLSDLRFYVSNVRLVSEDGDIAVVLSEHGRWQGDEVALIDLEDASGNCSNGTADTNARVLASYRGNEAIVDGLRFSVGVPFELNHNDPLAARAPLDDGAMHWHWRSGYKFMRAGVVSGDDGYWFHLGSSACEGSIRDIRSCKHPNRLEVVLPDYRAGDTIVIDLDSLAMISNLADGTIESCSSGPTEVTCQALYELLGIETGGTVARQGAAIFRVQAQ